MLAVASDKRSPFFPDVPNYADLGIKDASLDIWFGVWVPNNTPAEVTARLGRELTRVLAGPTVKQRFGDLGAEPVLPDPGDGELRFGQGAARGESLEGRGLTGAGMSNTEATNYARRYQFSLIDTKETQLRKLNELENALRYVTTEVGKGRGGDDLLKDFSSQFGKAVTTTNIPRAAILDLRSNPKLREDFDRKYPAFKDEVADGTFGQHSDWIGKDMIRVAEYYYVTYKKDTLIALPF